MIDYIGNYYALFTLYTAMSVEFSGISIMHSAYLIQYAMTAITGKPIISNEEPKAGFAFAFCWA
jgi:hypothetical protein